MAKGRKLRKRKSLTQSISDTFNKIKNKASVDSSISARANCLGSNVSATNELSSSYSAMSFTMLDAIVDDYENNRLTISNNNGNNNNNKNDSNKSSTHDVNLQLNNSSNNVSW